MGHLCFNGVLKLFQMASAVWRQQGIPVLHLLDNGVYVDGEFEPCDLQAVTDDGEPLLLTGL